MHGQLGERLSSLRSTAGSGNVYVDMPIYNNPLSEQASDESQGFRAPELQPHKRKGMRITFRVSIGGSPPK